MRISPWTQHQHRQHVPHSGFWFLRFLVTLLLAQPVIAPGQIYINEFLASNQGNNADPQGQFDDWIELYNAGPSPVDVGGMYMTDDLANPTRYAIPTGFSAQTTIAAGGYLVLWADRDTADGPLHLDFELNEDGEEVGLYAADGVTPVDTVTFGDQRRDVSFGRFPDGAAEWRLYSPPSPTAANTGGYEGKVIDTKFSIDRGIYSAPISVAITTVTPGAQIYYTRDGSEPTPSSTLYSGPVSISATTVLRARAYRTGWLETDIDTHTYIFLDSTINQPALPAGFPSTWGGGPAGNPVITGDYEVDPAVVKSATYSGRVNGALTQIPSLCVSMHVDEWFSPATGIYSNSNANDNPAWVRGCAAELIYPDGREGFGLNCAVRISGQTSPINFKSPKLSMRLKFQAAYGPTRLRVKDPIFPDSRLESINTLVLDARLNNVWVHPSGGQRTRGQYVRDQFMNDMQNKLGDPSPHGFYAHVYLNGLYWGVYCIHERPDDAFIAAYRGGEPEDHDVIKHHPMSNQSTNLIAGSNTDMVAMFNLARSGMVNQANYEALITQYLDLDPFINYMMVNFYAGNTDWAHKNYYMGRNRQDGSLFRYYSWDAEHVLKGNTDNAVSKNNSGGPTELHQLLKQNAEYKLHFADRAHKLLRNGGLFTPGPAIDMYNTRIDEIDQAIIMESARWGDYYGTLYTRDNQWTTELNRLRNTYFPGRSNTVISQLVSDSMEPGIAAPSYRINGISQHGGMISSGAVLTMVNPGAGTIWYTLDGTDPRTPITGAPTAAARNYTTDPPAPLTDTTWVRARVLNGGTWSAMNDAVYQLDVADYGALRITEVMYNPAPPTAPSYWDNDDFEFVEVKNTGDHTLDLTGVSLKDGVYGTFNDSNINDAHLLAPGDMIVFVKNELAFRTRYGDGVYTAQRYFGSLSNGGENLQLVDPTSNTIVQFVYDDILGWPQAADGSGHSLVAKDWTLPDQPVGAGNLPGSWRASTNVHGSPGEDDPLPPEPTETRNWWRLY